MNAGDVPDHVTREPFRGDRLARQTAPPELEDADNRERWGLGSTPEDRGPYLIELNVQYVDGLAGAASAFRDLFTETIGAPGDGGDDPWDVTRISKTYFRCDMTMGEWKTLIATDEQRARDRARQASTAEGTAVDEIRFRTVYKLWPDFPAQAQITHSISTIKADAALRSFEASGEGITWAVIDSGVDGGHAHFVAPPDQVLEDPSVRNLHRCFIPIDGNRLEDPDEELPGGETLPGAERDHRIALHRTHALTDEMGHGTHVAGIISGRAPADSHPVVLEREEILALDEEHENLPQRQRTTRPRSVADPRENDRLHGVAPRCRLVSLRVLDAKGNGRSSNIIRALEYIREKLNDNPKELRIHGVNLSVGYEFDAEMFACGQSPLCIEVNRLVQTGVVVVAAAGNTGYTTLTANNRVTKVALSNSINDPGNAESAITVGSTHRDSPHTYGISYFSSKGPTGDGRLKPDLVAPGERVVSCAAGQKKAVALRQCAQAGGAVAGDPGEAGDPAAAGHVGERGDPTATGTPVPPPGAAAAGAAGGEPSAPPYYIEDSGTSMAAPHVSGAIAAFLSIRREFIGRPADVKRIFLGSAIPLGRERYFEGHGLIDLMKAIQSI